MSGPRQSLRVELLVNLAFVTSAAVMVVGVATATLAGGPVGATLGSLFVLWLGATAVFVLFGVHVVRRLVVRPLERLVAEADTLAAGDLGVPRPPYETNEFADLAERYREMAADLLDVQSQIVRVEKLAGIGTLAAGVAHEVRNPLGALGAYVDLLRRRGVDRELTDAMRGAIERIERTVQSLLVYARPAGAGGKADLNEAVRTSLRFLEAQGALSGHRLVVVLEPELPHVRGDPHLLEQVVVNLVVNACQASPCGRVLIGTVRKAYEPCRPAEARLDDDGAEPGGEQRRPRGTARLRSRDIAPGSRGVLLYVADDGPGVPEELRERVFDPFYTTKDPGEGTGLGLAIVARTVHESGGSVWVDRAREGGAVFKVFLSFAAEHLCAPAEPSYAIAHC